MTLNKKPTLVRNIVFLLALMLILLVGMPLQARADYREVKPTKISAVGKKTITVAVGEEFDLKVKMSPRNAEDDYLRWKIVSGSKFIRFNDDDRSDDELEFKAKKAGTAKVRCYIKGTEEKITFTIKIKAATNNIKADSAKKQIVELGDDFDLEIKKYAGLKNKYLKWSIEDESIVVFDGKKKTGDEVEFRAKKLGKTKITCKNTKTGQKIKFNVTVAAHDYD